MRDPIEDLKSILIGQKTILTNQGSNLQKLEKGIIELKVAMEETRMIIAKYETAIEFLKGRPNETDNQIQG